MTDSYTVIDLEMTGLKIKQDKIIEIGAAKVVAGEIKDTYSCFLNIGRPIPERVSQLTGITDQMLRTGVSEQEGMEGLLAFMGEDVLLGQNFSYDYGFIRQWAVNNKRKVTNPYLDTLKIARKVLPVDQKKSLDALCAYFEINRDHGHRALEDAIETHLVYRKLLELVEPEDPVLLPKPMNFKVKRNSPVTTAQLEQIKKYRALHGVTEAIDWDGLTRSEASRLMERYYQKYGRS